jgi:hypothetical protein
MRTLIKLVLIFLACLALFFLTASPESPFSLTYASQATPQGGLVEGTVVARLNFRLQSGLITVPVRINGSKELRMYLDTGMSAPVVVLFHKESIIELGLKATQQVQLGGAGGQGRKPATLSPGVTIDAGVLQMTNQTLVIMADSRATSDWPVDGVIGKSLFDRYLAEIDYENSTLTLYDPAGAKIVTETSPIPLDLATGIPLIEAIVELEGGKKIPLKFAADLGHRSALSLSEDDQKGVLPPKRTIKGIGGRGLQGEVPAVIGRVRTLEIGSFTLRDIPTAFFSPETNPGLSRAVIGGNVGSLVWRKFKILLDYPEKKMFLIPNAYFDKPFPFNMAGLFLEQNRDDVYFVRHVIENTPASEIGIQEGDKITAINGRDVRKYPYLALLDVFNAAGRKVKLTLDRNGQTIKKTLKLRQLI